MGSRAAEVRSFCTLAGLSERLEKLDQVIRLEMEAGATGTADIAEGQKRFQMPSQWKLRLRLLPVAAASMFGWTFCEAERVGL